MLVGYNAPKVILDRREQTGRDTQKPSLLKNIYRIEGTVGSVYDRPEYNFHTTPYGMQAQHKRILDRQRALGGHYVRTLLGDESKLRQTDTIEWLSDAEATLVAVAVRRRRKILRWRGPKVILAQALDEQGYLNERGLDISAIINTEGPVSEEVTQEVSAPVASKVGVTALKAELELTAA